MWEVVRVAPGDFGCEVALPEDPEDPLQIGVAIDCELIPKLSTDAAGVETVHWSIDLSTVPAVLRFEGEACQRVLDAEASRIDLVTPCSVLN